MSNLGYRIERPKTTTELTITGDENTTLPELLRATASEIERQYDEAWRVTYVFVAINKNETPPLEILVELERDA